MTAVNCSRKLCAFILLAVLCPTTASIAQAETDHSTKPFRHAVPGYAYRFPFDHGTHDDFRTEWWYYTGHLRTQDGRRFGYQVTFFRRAAEPEKVAGNRSQWAIRHLYLAHVALTDLDGKRFRYSEKISRAGLGKAGADPGRLHVWIDHWSVEASSSSHEHHRLVADGDGFSLDLTVAPERPPVVHGERGVSRKGPAPPQASHYYSFPRLVTVGTLTVNGVRHAVEGLSWMDHEFGSGDLDEQIVGWDWFSLQLADRTSLMLYRLRRTDGTPAPVSSGTVIFPDGRTKHLSHADMQVEALDQWTSQASGARYPSRWRVVVPSLSLDVTLRPLLADQELVTSQSTQVTYWEGAVEASGTQQGRPITGQGYVELTGYAASMKGRL
jgi:predicted secreted hydrolase